MGCFLLDDSGPNSHKEVYIILLPKGRNWADARLEYIPADLSDISLFNLADII